MKVGASKLNVQTSYLILPIIIVVLVIAMLTSIIAHYVITLFALVYPAYMSFKVILRIFRPSAKTRKNCARNG